MRFAPILLGLSDVWHLLLGLGYQGNRSESPCPLAWLDVIDSHLWLSGDADGFSILQEQFSSISNLDLTPTTGSHDNEKQEMKKQFPFLHNYIIYGLMASASPHFLTLFWNNIKKNTRKGQ